MVNQYEKAKKAYIQYIKKSKSKASGNKSVYYEELPCWDTWVKGGYNSPNKYYYCSIEINNITYKVEPCQSNDSYKFNTEFLRIAKDLANQMKATVDIKIVHEMPEKNSWATPIKREQAVGIEFKAKPVIEYKKLINWLNRKGITQTIGDWDIYAIRLFGKRGYYNESGMKRYLAYYSDRCTQLLNELQQVYHYGDKLVLSKIKQEDEIEDLDYSIKYETECYGIRYNFYEVSIYTKGGKLRKTIQLI